MLYEDSRINLMSGIDAYEYIDHVEEYNASKLDSLALLLSIFKNDIYTFLKL